MNANSSTNRPDRPKNTADADRINDIPGEPSAETASPDANATAAAKRAMPEAARRALAEAAERRREADDGTSTSEPELGGRGGLDPARFGDWEIKGRAIDF